MFVGRNQEPGGTAGRIEDAFVFLRIDDVDDEVDDMTRSSELPSVALGAEDREQVFEGIAEPLTVIIGELVDDLEECAQGFRIAVRQVGVVEDVPEQRRDAGVLGHLGDSVGVKVQNVVAAKTPTHQARPAVTGEIAGKEPPLAAELFALGVQVVHELVDEGNSDLLDLTLGVGHLAHQDIACCVDAPSGFDVEHGILNLRTDSATRSP